MEYLIGLSAILASVAVYLYFELLKTRAQGVEIQKELDESRAIRESISTTTTGTVVINRELLPPRRFKDKRQEEIEKRRIQEQEPKAFRDLLSRPREDKNPFDVWYNSEGKCPPKSGSRPLSHYCIPPGGEIFCSGCQRIIKSASPTF